MKTTKYISAFLVLFSLLTSCSKDEVKDDIPEENTGFTEFSIDERTQFIGQDITVTITPGTYQSTEINFIDAPGVPYTPPKTEPSEGETEADLENVLIPAITATENNHLEYKISAAKLKPEEELSTSQGGIQIEIKVLNGDGSISVGYDTVYFIDNAIGGSGYSINKEHAFTDEEINITFDSSTSQEIEITLLDEAGAPSVLEEGETETVTINKIDDLNYSITSILPIEQLIEIKLTNENGDESSTNHLIHFYAHGTVDYYKTVEGIELSVDTTEKLTLIHGDPIEEDKLTSEDGLTERWQYLSDGIGFEVNTQTQIIEKVYLYSDLYEDYPTNYPHQIHEDLSSKLGDMKMKQPVNNIDIIPTNGTIKEATPESQDDDGVYYYDFENVGRFIYISDDIDTFKNKSVVQVIIGW